MDEAKVLYESRDHVARITLNRPDVLNAFDEEMAEQLDAAVERAPRRRRRVGPWCSAARGRASAPGQDLRFSESKPPGRDGALRERRRSSAGGTSPGAPTTSTCSTSR